MKLTELKHAIIGVCESDGFSVGKVEKLIEKHRIYKADHNFVSVCKFAALSCGISVSELFVKDRRVEPVLARRLIFEYYRKKRFTHEKIGLLFDLNHATVIHGLNIIKVDLQNKHPLTVRASIIFNNKINSQNER